VRLQEIESIRDFECLATKGQTIVAIKEVARLKVCVKTKRAKLCAAGVGMFFATLFVSTIGNTFVLA